VSVGAGVGVSVGTGVGVSVGIGVGVHSTRLVGRFPGLSVSKGWGHPIGSAEDEPALASTTPAARTANPTSTVTDAFLISKGDSPGPRTSRWLRH
jgi:hypothetical protein